MKFFIYLFLLLIPTSPCLSFQLKTEDGFEKVKSYLRKGDYELAQSKINSISKEFSQEESIKQRINAIQIKLYALTGNFQLYKIESDKLDSYLINAKEFNPELVIESLDAFLSYGEINKAFTTTQNFQNKIAECKAEFIILQFNYQKAQIQQISGNLEEALKILTPLSLSTEKLINNNGEKINDHKRFKIDLINLKALCLIKNNDYINANDLLTQNLNWTKENFSSEGKIADILYYIGMSHYEKGDYEKAIDPLQKAETSCGLHYFPHTENYIRIQELLIPALKQVDKNKEAQIKSEYLEAQIRLYFHKNNFYTHRNSFISIQRNILNKEWSSARKQLTYSLSDTINVPNNHLLRGKAYELLYQVLIHDNTIDKAEYYLTQLIQFNQTNYPPNSVALHLARLYQAQFYILTGKNYKQSEKIYSQSLDTIIAGELSLKNAERRSFSLDRISLYLNNEDFIKASNYSITYKEMIAKELGTQSLAYAGALQNEAQLNITLGIFLKAEENLNQALDIATKESGNESNYLISRIALSKIKLLIPQGRYEETESWIKKLKHINHGLEISILNEEYYEALSYLYIQEGKINQTEKFLKKLIQFRQAQLGNKHASLIGPLYLLATLHISKGDLANAESYLNQGLATAAITSGENSIKYADGLEIQGRIYSSFGYYAKAELELNRAIQINSNLYSVGNIYSGLLKEELALVYTNLNRDPKTIESLFNEASLIVEKQLGKQNSYYTKILKDKGIFYLYANTPQKSLPLLEQAIAITKDPHSKADLIWVRGKAEYMLQDYAKANLSFTESAQIYLQLYGSNNPGYIKSLAASAQINYILGDTKKSITQSEESIKLTLAYIDKVFPSLTEIGKSNYWESIKQDIEFYKNLAVKNYKDNPVMLNNLYNVLIKTKSILLSSSQNLRNQITQSNDTILLKDFELWVETKEILASAYDLNLTKRKELNINIELLEKKVEDLEKSITQRSGINNTDLKTKRPDLQELKKQLPENSLAVEITTLRLFTNKFTDSTWYIYLAVNKDPNTIPMISISHNGNRMDTKALKFYRNCVKHKIKDTISYKVFWQPIEKMINNTYDKIYLSCDGVYNLINPETIPLQGNDYVFDKYKIIPINTTRELITWSSKTVNKTPLAIDKSIFILGNPKYYTSEKNTSKVVSLPGTEKEVLQIKQIVQNNNWNVKLVTDEEATEESIKTMDQRKIIHIATHGFFLNYIKGNESDIRISSAYENPLMRCGILLKDGGHLMETSDGLELNKHDGILTAFEASNLLLNKTELVVLSACETGLGDVRQGEGVYGLHRSFMLAGAKNIVISLFKVNDEVTQELMTLFYSYWIKTNDKRSAFNSAKSDIKSKYPDPLYWGAFIMIGTE